MKAEYMLRVRYFLAHNKIKVVLCQLAFLLVSSFILVPVVFRGFYLAIKLSGYSSITKENFLDVLIKPGSIIYILLLIVLLMVFMLLNLTMYIVLFDASLRHSRHGLIEYLVQVEKHFFRFFGKRKIVRIFYMLPFAFAVYMPPFLMALNNNTVTKYLLKLCIRGTGKKAFWIGFAVIYLICIWVMSVKIPYIRLLILGNVDASKAKEQTRLTRRERFHHFMFQMLWELFIALFCAVLYAVFILVSVLVIKAKSDGDNVLILFYEVYNRINIVVGGLLLFICGMFNISAALQLARPKMLMYYVDNADLNKQTHYVLVSMVAVACVLAIYLNVRFLSAGTTPTYASLGATLITAHRGSSSEAPENTIPAFEKAIEEGADYVEMDVRLTSDGELVLMHDPSTKRTTGVNKLVCDTTYEELQQLDAGAEFSDEYAGTKIPTLQEAIDTCKGKVMMNIELKTVRNDGELEAKVAQVLKENNMEEQCIVTSFKQRSLVRIKKDDPDIVTGYIYSFGYSNRTNYEAMDVLSIDARYLTRQVVTGAHKKGIMVCAWTVNTSSEMRRMMAIGVDNIITDRVPLAKRTLKHKDSNAVSDMVKYIFEQ